MPDKAMADDEHVILLAELDILVGQLEVIDIRPGMNALPLEDVFRCDGVELAGDNGRAAGIGPGELRGIDGCANQKVAPIGVLERGGSLGGHRRGHGDDRNEDYKPPIQHF
jgi:hypothetical protein